MNKYSVSLFAFICFSFSLVNGQTIITSGLIAYYPMNGNTLDSSGNGNDLTLSGPSQYVTNQNGTANGAIEFMGDPVTYPYFQAQGTLGTSLDGSSLSISFWVNQQIIPQPAGWTFRIGQASASGQAITIALNYPDDLRWSFFNDDLDTDVSPHPALNTWYNVTGTYDASTQVSDLYYNGQLVATATGSQEFSGDNFIGIGWNGLSISDFSVYNRALAPTEVTQISAVPEPETYGLIFGIVGLIGVMKFRKNKYVHEAYE